MTHVSDYTNQCTFNTVDPGYHNTYDQMGNAVSFSREWVKCDECSNYIYQDPHSGNCFRYQSPVSHSTRGCELEASEIECPTTTKVADFALDFNPIKKTTPSLTWDHDISVPHKLAIDINDPKAPDSVSLLAILIVFSVLFYFFYVL